MLSGLDVSYRPRRLSVDTGPRSASKLRAGDRLPDWQVRCDGRTESLQSLLTGPGVHLLVDSHTPLGSLRAEANAPWLQIHRLSEAPRLGVVAVRPDGYIGFRGWAADDDSLRRWLTFTGATTSSMA